MYLLLLKFSSIHVLFYQHFLKYMLIVACVVCLLRLLHRAFGKSLLFRQVSGLVVLAFFVIYFGPIQSLSMAVLSWGSAQIGKRVFKIQNRFLQCVSGFFVLLQVFFVLSFGIGPRYALWLVVLVCGVLSIMRLRRTSKKQMLKSIEDLYDMMFRLSALEQGFVLLAFVYSSFPQTSFNWDSVFANIYNAKWYIELNSVQPLPESISSYFPQHAILYYAMFYAIGGLKSLQVAYLFPLFIMIWLFKDIQARMKFSGWYGSLMKLLLLSPIVFMQSTSGYYDMFVAVLLLLSIYLLFFVKEIVVQTRLVLFTLFVGIAGASKYFGMAMAVSVVALTANVLELNELLRIKRRRAIIILLVSATLLLVPLVFWMSRAYVYTGSPIFPFFQQVFRTPVLWKDDISVNDNAMTQSVMPASTWLRGGAFLYPVLTYFNTEKYIEATRGFTGFMYVLLAPIQVVFLVICVVRLVRRKATEVDLLYLTVFFGMYLVGILVRYYRYLWPFELTFGVLTFIYGWQFVKKVRVNAKILMIGVVLLYAINTVDMLESMRFSPEPQRQYAFEPDGQVNERQEPMWATLNTATKPVLDGSAASLARININQRAFQCNWYWTEGERKVTEVLKESPEEIRAFMLQFSYVIASKDLTKPATYCDVLLQTYPGLKPVVENTSYTIYAVE